MNWRDPWHSLAGGAEIYAWEFARALRDAGAHVEFVTAREPGAAAREERDGIHVVRRGGQLSFYAWALWWLLLHRRRLDAVLDADCGIPVFSPLVLSRRRTAIILLIHHVHLGQFRTYFGPFLARVGRFLEGQLMPRLYRNGPTLAVSASTVREMVEQLGWTGPVEIIHNGNASRSVSPVSRSTDRLVVLGRLATHKRIDAVIRAVGLLREARPHLRLDVVGRGPESATLQALVRELGLEDRVRLTGYLEEADKVALVAECTLHVSASNVEGWGQVVIEAASIGVPTLARDVPGLRDSIRDGETGWLLDDAGMDPAHLPEHLAAGIDTALAVLEDPTRRQQMREACVAWANQFSWEAMRGSAVEVVARAIREAS